MYGQQQNWNDWKNYYSIHLLARHRYYLHPEDIEQSGIKIFDEKNIQNYTKTFGIIARSIWNSTLNYLVHITSSWLPKSLSEKVEAFFA